MGKKSNFDYIFNILFDNQIDYRFKFLNLSKYIIYTG